MKKPPLKTLSILLMLGLLGLIIAWMAGVFVKKLPTESTAAMTGPVPASTYRVETVTDQTVEGSTGTITARDETTISSRLLASIQSIKVRAGDTVKAGDIIIELDDRDLRARVEQATQALNAAEAALKESQTAFDRIKELYERNVAAKAEYDRAEATLLSNKAAHERDRQGLTEARTLLSFTVIKSPIDGKVIERLAEAGDTASPGMPLLRIYNPRLLWLNANVRESLAAKLNIGDKLNAFIDAVNRNLPVTIDEIVPSADPGSRSVTVKALLPEGESLYPGMFGRLLIPLGDVQRIYIPDAMIKRFGQLEYVNIFADGQVSRRFIRTGRQGTDGRIEVVSGLEAGETIAMD